MGQVVNPISFIVHRGVNQALVSNVSTAGMPLLSWRNRIATIYALNSSGNSYQSFSSGSQFNSLNYLEPNKVYLLNILSGQGNFAIEGDVDTIPVSAAPAPAPAPSPAPAPAPAPSPAPFTGTITLSGPTGSANSVGAGCSLGAEAGTIVTFDPASGGTPCVMQIFVGSTQVASLTFSSNYLQAGSTALLPDAKPRRFTLTYNGVTYRAATNVFKNGQITVS